MISLRLPFRTAVVTVLLLLVLSFVLRSGTGTDEGLLSVVFLDVGQGDATFVESPNGTRMLIDGGRNGMVLRGLSKHMGFFDRDIDMVLITHPDLDHIGGLIDVLQKYDVSTIVMTENINDTPAVAILQKEIEKEGAEVLFARRGQVFDLGGGAFLNILFPDRDPTHLETNTSSIISELVYGESEFIFTGDSPTSIEEYLVSIGSTELESDVLKVGHHGSKTSSAEAFIAAVSPGFAVISASKDNSYGHPHTVVTERLGSFGVPYKNTADDGSVHLVSDGVDIWLR